MNSFLSPDNKIFQFINQLFYSAWLNILWFICCIPIFTIGASTTALFYVTLKLTRNEEGHITQQFFSSFLENFKKGTILWLILLVIGIFLSVDGYVLYHLRFENVFWTICMALLIGAGIVYCVVLLNIFPLLARFDNTIPKMFLNSFFIGVRYLFCTILMAAIYFVMYYIIIMWFTPLIVFGQGLCALICSWLISPILKKLEDSSSDTTTDESE